ncbi:MAG: Hypothetical protein AJITA_01115 [Acetilactobacillus jinshanensis]
MSTFAENMKPSAILGFNQKISKIPDLIKLTIGEPDFATPEHIKKAAVKAIEDNHSHYTNPRGILPLRHS